MKKEQEKHRHIIACLVDNEFGVLGRVIGLFSGRGYNIESLTVAEVDGEENLSRITIVTSGSDMIIEQIKALLERLVPIHKVVDLTVETEDAIERELMMAKVVCKPKDHNKVLDIANAWNARVMDSTPNSFVFSFAASPERLDEIIELMTPLGLIEICRTGSIAISRGDSGI